MWVGLSFLDINTLISKEWQQLVASSTANVNSVICDLRRDPSLVEKGILYSPWIFLFHS